MIRCDRAYMIFYENRSKNKLNIDTKSSNNVSTRIREYSLLLKENNINSCYIKKFRKTNLKMFNKLQLVLIAIDRHFRRHLTDMTCEVHTTFKYISET